MKTKNKKIVYLFLIMSFVLILTNACKKDDNNNNVNPPPATITDIDGNVYHTLKIGNQYCMVENLNTTKYLNDEAIADVTDNTGWSTLTTDVWCNYNNNSTTIANYSLLYNWYALSYTRNIFPLGWHVSTMWNWNTLIDYLGGNIVLCRKLEEAGEIYWSSPNKDADNSIGFTAIPGGRCNEDGSFFVGGKLSRLWTNSIDIITDDPNYVEITYYFGGAAIMDNLKKWDIQFVV